MQQYTQYRAVLFGSEAKHCALTQHMQLCFCDIHTPHGSLEAVLLDSIRSGLQALCAWWQHPAVPHP